MVHLPVALGACVTVSGSTARYETNRIGAADYVHANGSLGERALAIEIFGKRKRSPTNDDGGDCQAGPELLRGGLGLEVEDAPAGITLLYVVT